MKSQIIPILLIIFFIQSKEIFNETNKTLIITNSSEYDTKDSYKSRTEHLIIQCNIENMEANEFIEWTSLFSAEFYNLNTIGSNSFQSSQLNTVIIGNNVITIGDSAFRLCSSLINISMSNSVTIIKKSAFYGCSSLINITIPNSVTTIESRAFSECTSLNNIHVLEGNEYFKDKEGILYDKGTTTIICYPSGKQNETFDIPKSIKTIGSYSFFKCSLTNITITNFVTSIENNAFEYSSNLGTIIIGENVTFIGEYAFGNCENLKCIYFLGYESSEGIAENIFYGASTTNVMTSDLYKGDTFGSYNVIKGTPIDGCNPYRWATHTFTNSESFSQSNTYSKSNAFTKSNTFTRTNTIFKSNSFTKSNAHTQSNAYSYSITNYISITQTLLVDNTFLSHTIFVTVINSTYTYYYTQSIYYEYTICFYTTYYYDFTYFVLTYLQSTEQNEALSSKVIVGIVCGAVAFVLIVIGLVIFIIRNNKSEISPTKSQIHSQSSECTKVEQVNTEFNTLIANEEDDQWI